MGTDQIVRSGAKSNRRWAARSGIVCRSGFAHLDRLYVRLRPWLFVGPGFALLLLFLVWPLLWVIGMSFTSWDGLGPIHWVGLQTWSQLFADQTFWAALQNSLVWILLSATVPVISGFGLAVVFSRAGRAVGALGRALAVLPLLLPVAVTAVTWHIIYNPNIGPLNRFLNLVGLPQPDWIGDSRFALWSLFVIMLWSSVGFSVVVFTGALRTIDQTYFDLADVEGGGFWSRLRFITIPACRKTAAMAVIVTIVITSAVADLLYVMTTATNSTIMLPLDMTNRAFGSSNVSAGAAEASIEIGIGIVLAAIAFLVSGRNPGMAGDGSGNDQKSSLTAAAAGVAVCLLLLLPLLSDVSSALTSGAAAAINPATFPWPPNFSSFATAWNSGIGSGLGQSAMLGAVVVALTLVLSLPAAFALTGNRFPPALRRCAIALLVFSLLLPGEPYLIPLFYLIQQLHINDLAGLILAESVRELPFAILLLWFFMSALPLDLLNAAELEAGRGIKMLTRIIVPLTGPVAVATALWVFITSWSEATLPNILLINSTVETAPVALKNFAGITDTELNLLAAGSLLLVVPVVASLAIAYGPASRGLRAAGQGLIA